MFKKLFDKFTGRNILLALSVMVFALSAIFVFFSTDIGAVAYEKFFRGNVLMWGQLHTTEDIIVYPHKTGNAGAKNEIQGLPKVKLVSLGALSDGSDASGETRVLLDDTPVSADNIQWSEVDDGTAVLLTNDGTYYKTGTYSLKIALTAAAVDGDGAEGAAGANDNWEANQFVGFWIYATENIATTDFEFNVVDDTATTSYELPAAIQKEKWTWVEIDIDALTGGSGDVVEEVQFLLTATGAANLAAVDIYLDFMVKWDEDDDYDLGKDVLVDGILSFLTATTTNPTFTNEVEYTGYFLSTQSTSSFLVLMQNESTRTGIALIAYE